MSYRSWLKDATHVNDIDPWHTSLSGYHDDYNKMDIAREEKLHEYWQRPIPSAVQSPEFFNSRLHDSQFLSLTRDKNKATVTINDLYAETLVNDVNDVLELPHPQVAIPVELVFHDVDYVNTFRFQADNTLRHSRIEDAYSDPAEFQMTFKRDWFFHTQSRVQWVCEIMYPFKFNGRLSSSIYIVIDCVSVTVNDRRLFTLTKIYGPNIIPLWNDFLNHVDFPAEPAFYPQFVGGFYDYFERRLPAHNLTWEDLRPQ